jgi:TolB-like protein/cytochrome c-type biogenesis protein CcmH/NrfG
MCISGTVYDHVETKLALTYHYLGEQTVKNITKPVRVYRVTEPGGVPPLVTTDHKKPPAYRQRAALVAVLVLLVGLGGAVLRYLSSPSSSPVPDPSDQAAVLPLSDKPSIVVLPFVNMSGDREQEYFSDGITEDLTTDLSRLAGLFVIARNSAFTYKGKSVKIEEVSRELGVRYVLEGSVRKAEDRVRITAQLVDATTGHHLWAERYDRELKDIFALQDEITRQIVGALAVELTGGEQERLVRKNTEKVEAYDALLRGRVYYWRFTEEANSQARQMFERAIALDSRYADAYTLLGFTYWIEFVLQWGTDPAHSLERFAELAHQALTLDDSLPFSHMALGYVQLWKHKQYEQALAELKQAVALAPNSADVHFVLAEGLNLAGRHAEALGVIQKAMQLHPHYPAPYAFELGWAYDGTGQVEQALAAYKRAVNLNPDFLPVHLHLAALYSDLGQEKEARAEAAEVLRISPSFSAEEFRQGNVYADRVKLERAVANWRKAGLK